jgi:hypothetical protein
MEGTSASPSGVSTDGSGMKDGRLLDEYNLIKNLEGPGMVGAAASLLGINS